MSQAIKDWIEQDVEGICAQYADAELTREEAIRELERLGFGTEEARHLLDGAVA